MNRLVFVFGTLLAVSGCTPPSHRTKSVEVSGRWSSAEVSHVRVQMQSLGEVSNSGLLLPTVSPDGRWVAYLKFRGDQPPALDSLWSGKNMQGMSLHVRETHPDAPVREICSSGAIWPAWSPDSGQLLFISYKSNGACELNFYDVSTEETDRLDVGYRQMMTPALSPSGEKIAFIAAGEKGNRPRLFIMRLEDRQVTPCPVESPEERDLSPSWTADGRIVFIRQIGTEAGIVHWKPGEFPPEMLSQIYMSDSTMGRVQAFSGLGRSLSPNDQRLAYYDVSENRINLVPLQDGATVELKPGTRAGCWLGPRQFVAATNTELRLFIDGKRSALLARGAWLPLGRIEGTNQLILCTRGSHRRAFQLIRMQVASLP